MRVVIGPTFSAGAVMPPSSKDITVSLSRQLANYKLSDAVVKSLGERLFIEGLNIGRFNPCIYGICADYFSDKMPNLRTITAKDQISHWEVFPYGIIDWDHFHIRVAFNVDELGGRAFDQAFDRGFQR
jgi:hypothetical protein